MGLATVKDKYAVYFYDFTDTKFRKELSAQLLDRYGPGPFDEATIHKLLSFGLDYSVKRFEDICHNEKSLCFYQNALWLHEHATELVHRHSGKENFSENITRAYIAQYRRSLKYILEVGCEVEINSKPLNKEEFFQIVPPTLNSCLLLGEMMRTFSDLYAEQSMIEDAINIHFVDGMYVIERNHHYDFVFEQIKKDFGGSLTKTVYDEKGLTDLHAALEECLEIKYQNVSHLIAAIHEEMKDKGGEMAPFGWETLVANMKQMFGTPENISDRFFKGLTLTRVNKMPLKELVLKPYKLNRYIYKCILTWRVDGQEHVVIGKSSWAETIIQFATNAIPWGKAPEEWMSVKCFKDYVHRKEDEHDKWLDDAVETIITNLQLKFDRNVTSLRGINGIVRIDRPEVGEMDFLVITPEIFYVVDCKHLSSRYDIVNQKNDFNLFTKGSKNMKPYNQSLKNKVEWIENNMDTVQHHFQRKYKTDKIDLKNRKVEGVFVLNTPTLYMYNSDYRIYTVAQLEAVLTGKHIDPTFRVIIETKDEIKTINVSYPYLKKPEFIRIDFGEDEDFR